MLLKIFVFVCSCAAFNDDGHKTISGIAASRMSDNAKGYLLEHIPSSNHNNLSDRLADISVWADHAGRNDVAGSSQLHYAFMDFQKCEAFNAEKHCGLRGNGVCVVTGIAHYARRAVGKSLGTTERLEALAFITHFVADAHQPFHVGFREDRGGNLINVSVPDLQRGGSRNMPLHKIWDSYLFDVYTSKIRRGRQLWRGAGDRITRTFADKPPIDGLKIG
jgi:hypothetical protein